MGKLKDMFDSQIKGFGKHEKKKRWLKTMPKFINFNITVDQMKEIGISQFELRVTDLLDVEDKRQIFTKAAKVDENGLILNIKCPFCGEELSLNKHWNAYFCLCQSPSWKIKEERTSSFSFC